MKLLDKDFTGLVRDYSAVVDQSLNLPIPEFVEIRHKLVWSIAFAV